LDGFLDCQNTFLPLGIIGVKRYFRYAYGFWSTDMTAGISYGWRDWQYLLNLRSISAISWLNSSSWTYCKEKERVLQQM